MIYLYICLGHPQFFFITTLQFSHYRCFTSIGRLITWYFILFHVMVDGVLSLNALSDNSILVYRFIYINFVSSNFTNSLINSSSCLVVSLSRISYVSYHVICKQWEFYFFLSKLNSFFIFLLWFLWLGLPKLCWIKVVRVGISNLFLISMEMLLFTTDYDVNCEFVVYGLYYVEACSLSGPPW